MRATPFSVEMGHLVDPIHQDDHVRGPDSASVTLVEYGDYQCPFCGAAYPNVEALINERGDSLRFVFRHFPLVNVHQYAEIAADFAEAAGARGQFWRAHHWLYTHQSQLDAGHLRAVATQIDPDGGIAQEIERHTYDDRIHRDFIGGIRSGVNGTPTFFINGVRHDGGYSLPELRRAVDTARG